MIYDMKFQPFASIPMTCGEIIQVLVQRSVGRKRAYVSNVHGYLGILLGLVAAGFGVSVLNESVFDINDSILPDAKCVASVFLRVSCQPQPWKSNSRDRSKGNQELIGHVLMSHGSLHRNLPQGICCTKVILVIDSRNCEGPPSLK